jgi:ABC-2 type transport system permease protein
MSAVASVPEQQARAPETPVRRVTLARVIRSEWTKLWTLRSTRWSLFAGFVAMAGLGPLIAAVQMSRWSHLRPHERLTFDSINIGVGGWHLAQLGDGIWRSWRSACSACW